LKANGSKAHHSGGKVPVSGKKEKEMTAIYTCRKKKGMKIVPGKREGQERITCGRGRRRRKAFAEEERDHRPKRGGPVGKKL